MGSRLRGNDDYMLEWDKCRVTDRGAPDATNPGPHEADRGSGRLGGAYDTRR